MTVLAGSTTRLLIKARNIKKVRFYNSLVYRGCQTSSQGKYLLEREKMVKENNWKLDE